jgi:prolyl-tRNA editing enzyme YbaK/EbsC (Cys-tRNA(Pro) deacylase)
MVDPTLSPSVLRVRHALAALGAQGSVRVLDSSARTAREAADALGVEVGQIASSLLFRTVPPVLDPGHGRHELEGSGEPLLVLTSGAHRVDTRKVADLLGVAGLDRATPADVRTATGFAIGGVAPVGHPEPVRTLVDIALARYQVVWAAAGHPHVVFATNYDELVRITGGHPAEVA